MFKSEGTTKKANNETYDVMIGKNSKIDGNIASDGSIRIEGIITGDVDSKGNIVIGPDATVNGSINCKHIEISGKVIGNIICKSHLKVYAQGSLKGNIEVSSFNIEEGGIFDGNCKIDIKTKPEQKPEQKPHQKKA
ncbi:MAG: polymer-forming cytoskeletal protein [Bacillota bacterium]|nr:polymer-forming cytoskeletal protein [Bacillota bacterium]